MATKTKKRAKTTKTTGRTKKTPTKAKKTKEVKKSRAVAKTKKTTEIAISKSKQVQSWGGVGISEKPAVQQFCNEVAKIYGVPALGVNSMSGKPYLNKEGRLYLLNDMKKGKYALQKIETEFLHLSTDLNTP